ncbi:MAG: SH3 domain-containing protein [Spirulina sp. SIO3F2]|nr:SH3 domain-containing protein [Spirulina sp. SIO3F2]
MSITPRKFSLLMLTLGIITSLGQTVQAAEPASELAQVVNHCKPRSDFPLFYSQVTTEGGRLRIREEPAGEIIGYIPNGWKIVVLEWTRNGVWARVTGPGGFTFPEYASAPDFVEGWVSAGYLKDLGRFCAKPDGVGQLLQPEVLGVEPVTVQEDWLAMGDALAGQL